MRARLSHRPVERALDRLAGLLPAATHEERLAAVLAAAVRAEAARRGLTPRGGRLLTAAARVELPEASALLGEGREPLEAIARAYEGGLVGPARKRRGSYFTPAPLADAVVERALGGRAAARSDRAFRVCDPALGAGAFLLAAARLLASSRSRTRVLRECLFGVDREPLAVAVTEALLWLWAADDSLTLDDAGGNLRVGDALTGARWLGGPAPQASLAFATLPEPGEAVALDWRGEFSGVFATGGFDALVGNPPWVAFAGRAAAPLAPELRAHFVATYAAMRGYPTLHALFVERATELAPGGIIALLLPSPLADLDGYRAVRRVLTTRHVVREPLLEFGEDAFQAVVQPCFALIADAARDARADDRPWRLAERQRAAGAAEELSVPEVLTRLARAPCFPRELFREMGFQTSRVVSERLLRRAPEPDAAHRYPLLEGRDVHEFKEGPPRLFLSEAHPLLRASGCRLRPRADYEQVRFVVRQTARFPIAALHGGLPFRNTLLAGLAVDELPAELVVALLNSSLYRALHVAFRRDARQAAFPQVKVAHLRALPLPPLDPVRRGQLVELSRRATRAGLDAALRAALDAAAFELFQVSRADREAVLAFLSAQAPAGGSGLRSGSRRARSVEPRGIEPLTS
ncbi:MAG: N-6 DNA methylase [Sorangiineae bacterium]|nr:N-6 DNA methylase [Polyangiaceae bacterium]MEB2321164.1 N-6 DNA methylase [Sorangiineae bacterium]